MKTIFTNLKNTGIIFMVFAVLLLALSAQVKAQSLPAGSYGFTAQSVTFTEITGGTVISAIHTDDALSATLPIGFSFNFSGTNYQNFVVSSNGWVSFNTSVGSSYTSNDQSELDNIKPALMPLWDDISGAAGEARYEVSGTAPNRVLTIQCKDWRWNYSSAYPATISFQVKLYETTNVIEYIYRREAGTGNTSGSSGASIGIADAGAPSTYLVLNNSSAAPTASATTFTTDISVRPATGQLYRFTPPPPCNASNFPATTMATTNPSTICAGTGAQLNLSFTPPVATGITYQWQSSANAAGPFTNIAGATTLSYIVSNVTATTYYRCQISCSGNVVLTSSVAQLVTTVPSTPTANSGPRCGPGSVQLTAAPSTPTNLIRWYQSATGGLPLATGNTFNTPPITNTTTYYVAAGAGGTSIPPTWVGTGTGTLSGNPNPYYTLYEGLKTQYLIRASELIALGFTSGNITELAFDVVDAGGFPLSNFYISMKPTAATELTATWETGLTTVYTAPATFTPTANAANAYTFQNPISWDGVSNLVIEVCFNNPDWSSGHSVKYTSGVGFNASHYYQEDGNASLCTAPGTGNVSTDRPNIRLSITSGCETTRLPVVATVNPLPAVNIGADFDTCIAVAANFNLDAGPQPNNATYLWDNGATSSSRAIGQTGVYHVAVTNSFGCVGYDTINVTIRSKPIVDLGPTENLCGGGVKVLDAGPGGLNGGRYYWNTGDTTRTIEATEAGTYIVYVTSPDDCMTVDTVALIVSGQMPELDGILVTARTASTFTFTADNPVNIVQYIWDYGDGSSRDTTAVPTTEHQYTANGNYWLKLITNSTCGEIVDSIMVTIIGGVGVHNVANEAQVKMYPNPTYNNVVFLETAPGIAINSLKVFNVVGQEVLSQNVLDKHSNKHNIILNKDLAAGVYHIKIQTNKGIVNKKLELLK
ncbi:MAG: T9SS type A sorting domain-containing protein [Sphingobacteriales bacterium]|nr:MAG: T9SS type A sorting domain-containing protein [Sphingobacteriales bacterium]